MGWNTWTEQDWQALDATASRLKLDPKELAALMNLESSGRATVWGGDKGGYYGLIQFGAGARSETGLDPTKAVTPAAQMPYVEKYFQQRGFVPGKHNISNAYATVLGGNPNAFGSRDSNGTEAMSASRDMMPGGSHYKAVESFYNARKRGAGSTTASTNTSPTTDLSSGSLDITVKPYDLESKLAQKLSETKLSTPTAPESVSTPRSNGLDLAGIAAVGSDNNLQIDYSKLRQGKSIAQAYQTLSGKSPSDSASTNLSSIGGALQSVVADNDAYDQKTKQLQQGLSGNSSQAESPVNHNTHVFTTGNTGRSSGPHLDARVLYTDTKTGKSSYIDPMPYTKMLMANNKSVVDQFEVTSPYLASRAAGPHQGIDLGTPVGTKIQVPKEWKYLGVRGPDSTGGGGWVKEYEIIPGKKIQLLHGHDQQA